MILEFPKHCNHYYGPHSVLCLVTIWEASLCLPEGSAHPTKLSSRELSRHNSQHLRYDVENSFETLNLSVLRVHFAERSCSNTAGQNCLRIPGIKLNSSAALVLVRLIRKSPKPFLSSKFFYNLTEFPAGCERYFGQYSVACLTSIWSSVNCFPEGTGSPHKLSSTLISSYTGLGLRFEMHHSEYCWSYY